MLLRLKRSAPQGLAVRGKLYLVTYNLLEEREIETLICPTIEHRDYLILPLYYRLTVTYSPRFKRLLPLVCGVPKGAASSSSEGAHQGSSAPPATASGSHQLPEQGSRSGIRFHPGTKPEHSKGCILVPDRAAEDRLRELILSEKETWIEINNP